MKTFLIGIVMLFLVETAGAVTEADVLPCKPDAIRFCKHMAINMDNLLKCGNILLVKINKVSPGCIGAMKRLGFLERPK